MTVTRRTPAAKTKVREASVVKESEEEVQRRKSAATPPAAASDVEEINWRLARTDWPRMIRAPIPAAKYAISIPHCAHSHTFDIGDLESRLCNSVT